MMSTWAAIIWLLWELTLPTLSPIRLIGKAMSCPCHSRPKSTPGEAACGPSGRHSSGGCGGSCCPGRPSCCGACCSSCPPCPPCQPPLSLSSPACTPLHQSPEAVSFVCTCIAAEALASLVVANIYKAVASSDGAARLGNGFLMPHFSAPSIIIVTCLHPLTALSIGASHALPDPCLVACACTMYHEGCCVHAINVARYSTGLMAVGPKLQGRLVSMHVLPPLPSPM